jgi:hypothetical protein
MTIGKLQGFQSTVGGWSRYHSGFVTGFGAFGRCYGFFTRRTASVTPVTGSGAFYIFGEAVIR